MKKIFKTALRVLAIACATQPAMANQDGMTKPRLYTAQEWSQVCTNFETTDLVMICRSKLHRGVAYGRSMGTFEPITPSNLRLLQSRSGVFFKRSIAEIIATVYEDSGMRTRLELQDDVRCQSYASPPDLVGSPSMQKNYRWLVDAWVREYTDAPYNIQQVRVDSLDNRQTLKFDAVTTTNRTVSGVYTFDEQANAGIFTTCDHPTESESARRNASQFFKAVAGSARRFS
jgi:hypothetical protein